MAYRCSIPRYLITAGLLMFFTPAGCLNDAAGSAQREFPLDQLATGTITLKGATLRVWLARTPDEKAEGLMYVTAEEIADDQGMLFIFDSEQMLSFWMKNTVTPLDIAYARMDGTIVMTHQMPPLTLQGFPSFEPAMFALEMEAGAFERLGVAIGDRIEIPEDLLK